MGKGKYMLGKFMQGFSWITKDQIIFIHDYNTTILFSVKHVIEKYEKRIEGPFRWQIWVERL